MINATKYLKDLWPEQRKVYMKHVLEDGIVAEELFNFLCGDMIGYGISRIVFEYAPDPKNFVVKIDLSKLNANVREFHVWESVEHFKEVAKWFAPITSMSKCGRIMVQRRVNKPESTKLYPTSIPAFLTDIKPDNFGFIGKQFVCFDYALNLLIEEGMNTKKMRKVIW